jgi:hypothetical protein
MMRRRSAKRRTAKHALRALKTTEQLELQALHRVRRRFTVERTAMINQIRAVLLEHGIVIPLVGPRLVGHTSPSLATVKSFSSAVSSPEFFRDHLLKLLGASPAIGTGRRGLRLARNGE